MKFNKTFHPDDYKQLEEYVAPFRRVRDAVRPVVHHQHRAWEYAMALAALAAHDDIQTVLEIGAGASAMPAMLAGAGYELTVIDPDPGVKRLQGYADRLGFEAEIIQDDFMNLDGRRRFDAVVCLSTIEHVENDAEFMAKISKAANTLIVLSTDFHPDGGRQTPHHLRAYSASDLLRLGHAADTAFKFTDGPSWQDNGAHVFGYNFAMMALVHDPDQADQTLQAEQVEEKASTKQEEPAAPSEKKSKKKKTTRSAKK